MLRVCATLCRKLESGDKQAFINFTPEVYCAKNKSEMAEATVRLQHCNSCEIHSVLKPCNCRTPKLQHSKTFSVVWDSLHWPATFNSQHCNFDDGVRGMAVETVVIRESVKKSLGTQPWELLYSGSGLRTYVGWVGLLHYEWRSPGSSCWLLCLDCAVLLSVCQRLCC